MQEQDKKLPRKARNIVLCIFKANAVRPERWPNNQTIEKQNIKEYSI